LKGSDVGHERKGGPGGKGRQFLLKFKGREKEEEEEEEI
jgi:hypothetical protein